MLPRTTRIRASKLLFACALASGIAHAQDRSSAEELFQLGKGAMARQEYTKACNYFQASLNAEFALGTLLNLAICHEQAGKIASAWAEYRLLEDRAKTANPPQPNRVQFAKEHAEALRPRLSRVKIILSKEAATTQGLIVKVDGVAVAPELFEIGVPVDLGKRKLSASAPEREDWMQELSVDDEKLKLEATIPALKPGKPKPVQKASVDLALVERLSAERTKRTVGLVVGGIGIAGLVTGGIFGVLSIGAADKTQCNCFATTPEGTISPELRSAQDAYADANTYAWGANVGLGAGLIALGIGTYLVLTSSPSNPKSAWVFRPGTL